MAVISFYLWSLAKNITGHNHNRFFDGSRGPNRTSTFTTIDSPDAGITASMSENEEAFSNSRNIALGRRSSHMDWHQSDRISSFDSTVPCMHQ